MSTLLPDTTSTTIGGRDGTADFTIDNGTNIISYKCILDMMRFREVIEMTVSDTFCEEGQSDQEPGRSQIVFEISGVGKKNGPASGPLIPAPQNVPIVITVSAGCHLDFNANFTEANCERLVNQTCRIGGRGLSKKLYTLTWDKVP